jgi:hypothetical protein
MSFSFWVSHWRMTPRNGTVERKRLAVFEVIDCSTHRAMYTLRSSKKVRLTGPEEYLEVQKEPPRGWAQHVERVEVAP